MVDLLTEIQMCTDNLVRLMYESLGNIQKDQSIEEEPLTNEDIETMASTLVNQSKKIDSLIDSLQPLLSKTEIQQLNELQELQNKNDNLTLILEKRVETAEYWLNVVQSALKEISISQVGI
ncbi:mediator of RNA polymerase ii transcription subunit 21 [Anaeramoeba ignava]|uniref:Mediator of RNA polymerase II transcription subunit 21 n=1 Tax=Anaeramoeba ignava TaxID=1746090 RepID=A0A9Q0LG49_ANAIG|nr:mediator of RNA polymerase ii transcription subunit 21 [Anaeramoeba ignava]